jgi:hypothetical protein
VGVTVTAELDTKSKSVTTISRSRLEKAACAAAMIPQSIPQFSIPNACAFHSRIRAFASVLQNKHKMAAKSEFWPFPIGTPGVAWGPEEKLQWKARVGEPKRTYQQEVLAKLEPLKAKFDVFQYGALNYIDAQRFPLFAVRSRNWQSNKPNVLITGGVHGYETSGVQGAIMFIQTRMEEYSQHFNIIVAPCVSPWGYEVVQRWNANAVDPNRSFFPDSGCEESVSVLKLIASLGAECKFLAHFDLHETTDTDESEFRPAKSARDGSDYTPDVIPDGFYLVGNSLNPQPAWHAAMIESVRAVTHIAPPDSKGNIIGEPVTQEGVVVYPVKTLFLCSSCTDAEYSHPPPTIAPVLCTDVTASTGTPQLLKSTLTAPKRQRSSAIWHRWLASPAAWIIYFSMWSENEFLCMRTSKELH